MYTTINGTTYISGDFGKYDRKIKNNSVRYARNSVDNFKKYLSNYTQPNVNLRYDTVDFSSRSKSKLLNRISDFFKNLKFEKQMNKLEKNFNKLQEFETKRTPLSFVQKYMPGEITDGNIDKMALMAAAYEEMGKTKTPVSELNSKMINFENLNEGLQMVSDALDINEDGYVDLAEYSTSILLEDSLSSDTNELKHENINGIITKDGSNKSLAYYARCNTAIARSVFSQMYKYYHLNEAKEAFLANKNNIA